MGMLTDQQIFDKVTVHLMEQGVCAMEKGFCSYRTPEGLKCAIGALIPDSIYRPDFEGKGVDNLIEKYPEEMVACGIGEGNSWVLGNLQGIHDCGKHSLNLKKCWYDHLIAFAESRNLDTTVLDRYNV